MVYQIKFKNLNRGLAMRNSNGFSLLELILVIGISVLLFNVATSGFSSFKSHSNLSVVINGVVEGVRVAQSNAQSGRNDSKWGIEILSNSIVVFQGNTYASRVVASDEILNFPSGINASGLSEIVFEKISGTTTNTGTIVISGNSESKNININAKGTVTY